MAAQSCLGWKHGRSVHAAAAPVRTPILPAHCTPSHQHAPAQPCLPHCLYLIAFPHSLPRWKTCSWEAVPAPPPLPPPRHWM